MGNTFGRRSLENLVELHADLIILACHAVQFRDFTIIEAYRNESQQNDAVRRGASQVKFPNSAHNHRPTVAFDFIPFPFRGWNNIDDFRSVYYDGLQPAARQLDIPIRWGGDWDRDGSETDERFRDFGHVELHPWRSFI